MSRKNKNALYRGRNLKKQEHARCCAERRFEKFTKKFFAEKESGFDTERRKESED